MPNHKSCKKKVKVNKRRHAENLSRVQVCKAEMKKLKKIENSEEAVFLVNSIKKHLDKIGTKHVFHANKVNRLKSRSDKLVNKIVKNNTAKASTV